VSIQTPDQFFGAAAQDIVFTQTASRAAVATGWFSVFDLAGGPGAGTLAGSSTAAGVVPTDTTAGFPLINAFAAGGGIRGELAKVAFSSTVACRLRLYDCIFKAGAYAFSANQALSGQPSFAARLPLNGATPDYNGLEIWVEQVTAATGNLAVNVTYTNLDGVTGRTTGATGIGAAPTLGRCWQLPLQAGDNGVQLITNVAGSVATVGTFNVLVLRRLWEGRVNFAGHGDTHGWGETGRPQVFADSALMLLVAPDSTATGIPDLGLQIRNG
jgi:hypothetical protein